MKRITLSVLAILWFSLFNGGSAFACDFCLLSQGISPLDTMKGTGIRVTERYTLLNQVYQGTAERSNPGATETHWTTELTGFYGITPDLMVLAVLPYKNGRTTGEADMTAIPPALDPALAGSAKGIGDVALMVRYSFLKVENPDSTTIAAAIAGVKFATGRTDAKTFDGMNYLDSHLQPGTGSTDHLFGLSFSHALTRFSISANVLGTITTSGTFGVTQHEFGNALNYDVTAKYRIAPVSFSPTDPQWFFALGVNGESRQREKENWTTVPDSGGTTLYLSPGVQIVLVPHWVVDLSYRYAVYHNLYGTQLGETYKAVSGVTYLF